MANILTIFILPSHIILTTTSIFYSKPKNIFFPFTNKKRLNLKGQRYFYCQKPEYITANCFNSITKAVIVA